MSQFFLTNLNQTKIDDLNLLLNNNKFKLFGKREDIYTFKIGKTQISFLLDGFILPRLSIDFYYSKYSKFKLLQELYHRYGLNLINHIKGNFVLIIIINEELYVYNDRIGIRKFFYYIEKNNFILTSHLKLLTNMIISQVDNENLAIYSIMNQFIDGKTFIKNVSLSKPSSKIYYDEVSRTIKCNSYWKCDELLNFEMREISYSAFSKKFETIIRQYIDYLKPDKVSLSLTGGLDSRTILAALLHIGVRPDTFTYGCPQSGDVMIARQIADLIGLNHKQDVSEPSANWFSNYADEIINIGNSLTHIHRAHRLSAVADFSPGEPGNEILFGGYMGGELLRNFYYDGIIITDFTKEWMNSKENRKELILKHLIKNFIKVDSIDVDVIIEILSSQRYSGNDIRLNEFFFTFLGMANSYHSQDINLFGNYVKYPVPIYLDIDFLNMIFESKYNFKTGSKYRKFINRIKGHELYCYIIYSFSPPLADIPMAKQVGYKPKEIVEDNGLIFLWKRLIRKVFSEQKYIGNFSLDNWMKDYVGFQLEDMQNSKKINNLINISDLIKQFKNNNHKTDEKYWRKFTNSIFFSKLFDFYLK